MVKDRYPLGLISGLGGGLAATAVNLVLIVPFQVGHLRFIDFVGLLIFGHLPHSLGENLFSFFTFLGFTASLGLLFAHLISIPPKPYLLLKATHFGLGVWFVSYALTFLFKVPELARISLASAITNLFAAAAYGLGMGLSVRYLLKKTAVLDKE